MTDAAGRAHLDADSRALRAGVAGLPADDPAVAAAQCFAAILDSDFDTAVHVAGRAPATLATHSVGRLAVEMSGHATLLPSIDDLVSAVDGLDPAALVSECWSACLVAEAAMAAGRLVVAEQVSRRVWESLRSEDPHGVFAGQTLTRALLFQGRLEEARTVGEAVELRARAAGLASLNLVIDATLAYVFALRDEGEELDRRIAVIESLFPQTTRNYFTGGSLVLAAYALAAAGRAERAAQMMLRAGGGPDLDLLQSVDRAYGYELLVAAALADGDTSTALKWGAHAAAVPAGEDCMTRAAQRRTSARLAAAEGDPALGAALAEEAAAIAAGQTGHLDATRAQLIAGSVLLHDVVASPAARQTLQTAGGRAGEMGAVALAVLARRDLRSIGLRWTGAEQQPMTRRERQVADLLIAGMTDARIGRVLGISERTVHLHVGKVLRALGVHSRSGVVAALTGQTPTPTFARDLLTPRQQQVADLVARGYPNHGVAGALQVSVKTIEKHVGDIYRRLDIDSRAALASGWGQI